MARRYLGVAYNAAESKRLFSTRFSIVFIIFQQKFVANFHNNCSICATLFHGLNKVYINC